MKRNGSNGQASSRMTADILQWIAEAHDCDAPWISIRGLAEDIANIMTDYRVNNKDIAPAADVIWRILREAAQKWVAIQQGIAHAEQAIEPLTEESKEG